MTDLIPVAILSPVPQLETTDRALAGTGNPMNRQAQALLNRDKFREEQIAANAAAASNYTDALRSDLADDTDPLNGAALVARVTQQILDIATLRLVQGRYDGDFARTMQYRASSPGVGPSLYRWSSTSTATANNSTIIQATGVVTGRWLIQLDGALKMTQAGAIPDYSGSTGTDNRLALNEGLNAWPHVEVDGHYGITFDTANNGAGLIFQNDFTTLEFSANGKLSALAHNDTIYQFLRIWDRNSCKVIRANLDGRRDLNAAVTGEFGMGIDLRGGTLNRIEGGATADNMWGDGYYIGHSAITGATTDTWIESPRADNCRRQGMSIVSANRLAVFSPVFSNINGTPPQAGIDIEPNSNDDLLVGVRIYNPVTLNCTGAGMLVYLGALAGAVDQVIDIDIYGHVDDGSLIGASVGGANSALGSIKGHINLHDPVWRNSKQNGFASIEHASGACAINVIRPVVQNPNRNGLTSQVIGAVFATYRPSGSLLTYPIGNVRIKEPSVIMTSGTIPALFSFDDQTALNTNVINCHFEDPVELTGLSDTRGFFLGLGTFSDKYRLWSYQIAGSSSINGSFAAPLVMPATSATLTIAAGAYIAGMADILVSVPSAGTYTITSPAAGSFIGLGGAVVSLRTIVPGSSIRIRPMGSDKYLIVERLGLWTEI